MPLTKFKLSSVANDGITSAKIKDGDVAAADLASNAVTTAKIADDAVTNAKMANNAIDSAQIVAGAVDDAHLASGITASKLTGALPAISGANLTGLPINTIENNIAMLAFYRATDHSKTKYSLVDQVVDDFNDATGIDASASTNENLSGGAYAGQTVTGANPTGGTITTSGSYRYHEFQPGGVNSSLTTNFVIQSGTSGAIDYLIVGAGGSGRSTHAGSLGAGAGGSHQLFTNQTKSAGTYPIVVAGNAGGWTNSNPGQSSSAFGTTKAGGANATNTSGAGANGTTYSQFSQFGENGVFGGGGGWHGYDGGTGGGGYGGNYNGQINGGSGLAKTGGGGGSGNPQTNASGDGGSGTVLIRYLTTAFEIYNVADITLQSTANTAKDGAPTTGDLVTLIENSAGTATLNTDIKGYISRDNGSTWTQGTLADEGDWGTNKKILAFHDLDISGQPSGTSIKYKITTHNQSASKHTKIHATSLAWA